MSEIKVKILDEEANIELPSYETLQSAGMDIRANLKENVILKKGERKLIKTGLACWL